MEAITSPKGSYQRPPDDRLPIHCPACGAILEHFLQRPAAAVPEPQQVQRPEQAQQEPQQPWPAPAATPASPPLPLDPDLEIDLGDLFFPSSPPVLIATPEQVLGNKARPEKAAKMTLPAEQTRSEGPESSPSPTNRKARPVPDENAVNLSLMDDPRIGGKITVFALLYGDEEALHRRCLQSILATASLGQLDLRVGCNQVGAATESWLRTLPITRVYADRGTRRKYPAMREMFWDPSLPIETPWVCWFDDDSYVRHPSWLTALCEAILAQPPEDRVAMFGQKMYHPLKAQNGRDPRQWFMTAPWYRRRPFRNRFGQPAPNGSCVHFVSGGFWCLSLEAIQACDIPDSRLNHNGGDVAIGEQLWQGRYQMRQFNDNKRLIHTSAHERRGFREEFPWRR